jgi:osmotically-inducible protein OsmY
MGRTGFGRFDSPSEVGRSGGPGAFGFDDPSDERVREDVSDVRRGEIDASEVEVLVASGEVTLEGSVPDRSSKRLAEGLIENLPGVKQVHNRLRVAAASDEDHQSES